MSLREPGLTWDKLVNRVLSGIRILLAKCVKNVRDHINRDAALEMEAGPPKPACRSRLQTTISCVVSLRQSSVDGVNDSCSAIPWFGNGA
jgi:hypothetical protein